MRDDHPVGSDAVQREIKIFFWVAMFALVESTALLLFMLATI